VADLCKYLDSQGVEIIATGGTANLIRDSGINCLDVNDITGFPELFGGRVKSLHPKIFGALLYSRGNDVQE